MKSLKIFFCGLLSNEQNFKRWDSCFSKNYEKLKKSYEKIDVVICSYNYLNLQRAGRYKDSHESIKKIDEEFIKALVEKSSFFKKCNVRIRLVEWHNLKDFLNVDIYELHQKRFGNLGYYYPEYLINYLAIEGEEISNNDVCVKLRWDLEGQLGSIPQLLTTESIDGVYTCNSLAVGFGIYETSSSSWIRLKNESFSDRLRKLKNNPDYVIGWGTANKYPHISSKSEGARFLCSIFDKYNSDFRLDNRICVADGKNFKIFMSVIKYVNSVDFLQNSELESIRFYISQYIMPPFDNPWKTSGYRQDLRESHEAILKYYLIQNDILCKVFTSNITIRRESGFNIS